MKTKFFLIFCLLFTSFAYADDGYRLWLRYDLIKDQKALNYYCERLKAINFVANDATLIVAKNELLNGLKGLLGITLKEQSGSSATGIIIGTPKSSSVIRTVFGSQIDSIGNEGYQIRSLDFQGKKVLLIASNSSKGVLYGVFTFLRRIQTSLPIDNLSIVSEPKIKLRILNHWDNLNRTVERGYAGASIWNWHQLPDYIDKRYIDYARADASIGINATVLTNVNANSLVLTSPYLLKVKALADVFRNYGIKVFLTARFSAPIDIGGLPTADPLDKDVIKWWKSKCDEIYKSIPDFGGFLVKANSEGQPGPQSYGRNHADGANMLAMALAPHEGIVIWRAFVYDVRPQEHGEKFEEGQANKTSVAIASADRAMEAYNEFKPLDGQFENNVLLQVKNGPIDFQPREPFSPLFGAMPKTVLVPEFQITQEYLGQGTHLVFEAPLIKEVFDSDTYVNGKHSTVATIIEGKLSESSMSAIAGVANIGNERNWTGHLFGQANWYAFGRLAWDNQLSAKAIAEEWIRQTFSNDATLVKTIIPMMLQSREAVVNYMTPLGLHHIMGTSHHYGPAPWVDDAGRPDWNPVYYHKADSAGIGFDRTASGSNALAQYSNTVEEHFENLKTCDERFLLWFHHVPWTYKMRSGKSLWEELCNHYQAGVDSVTFMQSQWQTVANKIDLERFQQVTMFLRIQKDEACWWRDACLLYFQTFSKMKLPDGIPPPKKSLEFYKSLKFPLAPGISGNL